MQLKPREYFPIVRQLRDPFDTNAYYVQAKIRNENTDELIDTVNLTDKGSQLFVSRWQVPPDTGGEGFWISIETVVYTDAGYTTKAENYERTRDSYLVFDRSQKLGGGGYSGGADISYNKIREIISSVIDEKEKIKAEAEAKKEKEKVEEEKPEPIDLKPVMQALADISTAIAEIEKPEKIKFDAVLTAISNTEKAITKAILDKEVTEKTDLSPIVSEMEDLTKTLKNTFVPKLTEYAKSLSEMLPEIEKSIKDFTYIVQLNGKPVEKDTTNRIKKFI
jgi:hypothetical protein